MKNACWLLFLSFVSQSGWALEEYSEEILINRSVRSLGTLGITNRRGNIQVTGWALDKIRVLAIRKVWAKDSSEFQKWSQTVHARINELGDHVEVLAEYGQGLDMESKIEEKTDVRTQMDLKIRAPSRMKLKIWAMQNSAEVEDWNGDLEVRNFEGRIQIRDIKSKQVTVASPQGEISLSGVRGSASVIGGEGFVSIQNFKGERLYLETTDGNVIAKQVEGRQTYVTDGGNLNAIQVKGRIDFRSQSGMIQIEQGSGFLSGTTHSGSVRASMSKWEFEEDAFLRSQSGDIQLSLPQNIAADFDLKSVLGKTFVDFLLEPLPDLKTYGPLPANQIRGRVARGGKEIQVFTQTGNIHIKDASLGS